jgi:uncharacterized protein
MKIQFQGFDWDAGNRAKCQKHGLSLKEIEIFFSQDNVFVMPDIHHSKMEEPYIAYGPSSNGRPIFVAFTFRIRKDEFLIRPISARYMHEKEAKEYEEKSSKISNR